MESLQDKKKKNEIMGLEMSILKLEAREMELEEERQLIGEKVQEQRERLAELQAGNATAE